MRCAILILSLVLVAAGCGQRGALYLRENPPSGVKPPRPEPYKPLPYPNEGSQDEAADAAKK